MLSKEIFYQFPESADSRKLVVFSDSREDAASISNGIERSHYGDLVREAIFDELEKLAVGKLYLLEDLQSNNQPIRPEAISFAQRNPNIVQELQDKIEIANSPIAGLPRQFQILRDQAIAELNNIRQVSRSRTVSLRVLFEGIDNVEDIGLLIQRLVNLGVNPAGNDALYQELNYDGRWHHWTKLFDFQNGGWQPNLSPEAINRREEILRAKVKSELCNILFGRLYFGIEGSGLSEILHHS